jgi:hypothetical protein
MSDLTSMIVSVPNRRVSIGGNSQTCLCGESVLKALDERWHHCTACGLSADRDVVSGNIAMGVAFGSYTSIFCSSLKSLSQFLFCIATISS